MKRKNANAAAHEDNVAVAFSPFSGVISILKWKKLMNVAIPIVAKKADVSQT